MAKNNLIPMACCLAFLGGCAANKPMDGSVMSVAPAVSTASNAATPASFYQLGRYYQGQLRYDQAVAAYQKSVAADPGYSEAYNGLGVIYSQQGRFDAAEQAFRSGLEQAPRSAHLLSNLGYAYYLQGRYEESVETLKQAVDIDPDNRRAAGNLKLALEKSGKAAEASAIVVPPEKNASWTQPEASPPAPVQMVSGKITPVEASHVEVVQVAPAVFEIRDQRPVEPLPKPAQPQASNVGDIHIEIANGNGITGMAKRIGRFLKQSGYAAPRLTNQKPFNVEHSQIQYRSGYENDARLLQSKVPGQPSLVQRDDLRSDIKLRLLIGKDWGDQQAFFK
jgi:Flp pilus assembly protein TadD